MNKKLHDVMAYFCTQIKHKSDLSKARLTKLVYLADWKMSQKHGSQISNIKWLFNHYGPYVDDVVGLARDNTDFHIIQTRNHYGSMKEQFDYVGDKKFIEDMDKDEIKVLDEIIDETESMYFNEFVDHVYSTYPVKSSNRYSTFDLQALAKRERMANKSLK